MKNLMCDHVKVLQIQEMSLTTSEDKLPYASQYSSEGVKIQTIHHGKNTYERMNEAVKQLQQESCDIICWKIDFPTEKDIEAIAPLKEYLLNQSPTIPLVILIPPQQKWWLRQFVQFHTQQSLLNILLEGDYSLTTNQELLIGFGLMENQSPMLKETYLFHTYYSTAARDPEFTFRHLDESITTLNTLFQYLLSFNHPLILKRDKGLIDFLDTLPEPVFVKDEYHHWIFVNEAFCALTGYSKQMLGEKSDEDLFDSDTVTRLAEREEQVFHTGQPCEDEEMLTDVDGLEHIILIKRNLFHNENGHPILIGVIHDITPIREMEEVLQDSLERLATAQKLAHVGDWQIDLITGRVTWSEEMFKIFGLDRQFNLNNPENRGCSSAAILHEDYMCRIHPDDVEASRLGMQKAISQGISYQLEQRIMRPNGEIRDLLVRGQPLFNDNGQVIALFGTALDISDRKTVERMKDELISVISHELRTPMSSIQGALKLIQGGKLGELNSKGQKMLDIAVSNCERMNRLIYDILDLQRLKSGLFHPQFKPCSAVKLAKQAITVMNAIAHSQEIVLNLTIDNLTLETLEHEAISSLLINADGDYIVQVLTHLLENAVKFSPAKSTITLVITAQTHQKYNEIVFKVIDQGKGIPQEQLESIFNHFYQIDSSDSRQFGGTGLGLAISREIIQQHGGKIWVESQLNQGSVFQFSLKSF